jgi:hypothetical protein
MERFGEVKRVVSEANSRETWIKAFILSTKITACLSFLKYKVIGCCGD